jgi:hypothetical protein
MRPSLEVVTWGGNAPVVMSSIRQFEILNEWFEFLNANQCLNDEIAVFCFRLLRLNFDSLIFEI